ncbi:MAG: cytochrome c [Bryobacteraceae bacterium]
MLAEIRIIGIAMAVAASLYADAGKPTFARDVAPILQKNCQGCHRPGQAAPFSLLTYEQARPWAKAIKGAVLQKKMPPWFADPHYGKFANDPSMTQQEVDTLVAWADAGAPLGNRKHMPRPKQFVEGWTIPKPDVVLQLPKPFAVPATGILEYQYIIIPTGFTEDKWVEHVQAAPTDYSVVHHIVAYVRTPGSNYFKDMPKNEFFEAPPSKENKDAPKDDVPNDWLTGYAPGQPPDMFKPGQAKLIPAGSDIVLEIHYMPEGKAATDQSRLGLVLAKQPPTERTMTLSAGNSSFKIPPGDPNFRVDASFTLPEDVTLLGLHPHMHMRGKSAEYKVVFADGRTETLLSVPRYNWRWQLWYDLAEPMRLPKGTKLLCTEHFDNSPNNPENPDATKTVIWGQQSFDEMMVCMFNVAFDARITTRQMLKPERPKQPASGEAPE